MNTSNGTRTAAASSRSSRSDRWICFKWRDAAEPPVWKARFPDHESPPELSAEWLNKPHSMRAATFINPADAIGWVRAELTKIVSIRFVQDPDWLPRRLADLDHHNDPSPHRCSFGPCDTLCWITRHNRIASFFEYLTNGVMALAIVPNNPEEQRLFPKPAPPTLLYGEAAAVVLAASGRRRSSG